MVISFILISCLMTNVYDDDDNECSQKHEARVQVAFYFPEPPTSQPCLSTCKAQILWHLQIPQLQ